MSMAGVAFHSSDYHHGHAGPHHLQHHDNDHRYHHEPLNDNAETQSKAGKSNICCPSGLILCLHVSD